MALEHKQFNRKGLLTALEQGWKQYLTRLHALSEEEQARYAQQQGFARVQDVLAHIMAWWERSMQRSTRIIRGHVVPRTADIDAFNTRVIQQYQHWTREDVEAKFATTLTTFEKFLRELPETAFENERIQLWLRIDTIGHYEDHRLPNAPTVRKEMSGEDAVQLMQLFEQHSIPVIVDGGWSVDALLGEQTRAHADLDIAVEHKDVPKLRALLEARGYKDVPRDDTRDCNFVMGDDYGHEIDFHSYTFDAQGNLVFGVEYPLDSLTGSGSIQGYPVKCISAEWLVKFHMGYEMYENDYHDVDALCKRFGIALPPEYEKFTQRGDLPPMLDQHTIRPDEQGTVLLEQQGAVAALTLSRPAALNALTWKMYEDLETHLTALASSETIRVIILRGDGPHALTAGTDISQFEDFSSTEGLAYEHYMETLIDRLASMPQPVLTAIQGYAVGAGLIFAAVSDLRYATPSARFGAPMARTLGNCLSLKNYQRITLALGPMRTKELLFTSRLLSADEALRDGFLTAIIDEDHLFARVHEIAQQISTLAPLTHWATKEAFKRIDQEKASTSPDFDDVLSRVYDSHDFAEGVQAHLEKRRPQWLGR